MTVASKSQLPALNRMREYEIEKEKAKWIREHPDATSREYERAIVEIVLRCVV